MALVIPLILSQVAVVRLASFLAFVFRSALLAGAIRTPTLTFLVVLVGPITQRVVLELHVRSRPTLAPLLSLVRIAANI